MSIYITLGLFICCLAEIKVHNLIKSFIDGASHHSFTWKSNQLSAGDVKIGTLITISLQHQQDIVSRDGQMYRKKEMETKGDMLHCGK